jgi:hypothetical protein
LVGVEEGQVEIGQPDVHRFEVDHTDRVVADDHVVGREDPVDKAARRPEGRVSEDETVGERSDARVQAPQADAPEDAVDGRLGQLVA